MFNKKRFIILSVLLISLIGCTSKNKEKIKLDPTEAFHSLKFETIHVDSAGILVTVELTVEPNIVDQLSRRSHNYETLYRMEFGIYEVSEFD